MSVIELDGATLSVENVVNVARHNAKVVIAPACRAEITKKRDYINEHWIDNENADPVYGFNTGVGKLVGYKVSAEENDRFQMNIVKTHAACIGEPASEEVVRAMMVSRINAFCLGVSGLRIETVDRLVELLNNNVHPVVPSQGSVGASGDLAPLAHMVSVMIGFKHAEAYYKGERMPAQEALKAAGLSPTAFKLQAKDCLALINGNNYCAGMAALNIYDAEMLMKTADITGALSLEAVRGEQAAFDDRIHQVRRQVGQIKTAENIRTLTKGSQRTTEDARKVHLRDDLMHPTYVPRVQDQYSFRCLPQVHGSCRDNLVYAKSLIEKELNAATDNPLVFWDDKGKLEFLSGGNFHCEPIAFAMDILAMSLAEIGSISERRLFALCDTALSYGLPPNLSGDPVGLNTGYAVISCSAAAVVSENKTLCFPAVADTIPTKSSQEDHVSMAAWACRKTRQIIDNMPKILGIEYIIAGRSVFITQEPLGQFNLGSGTSLAYQMIHDAAGYEVEDHYVQHEVNPAMEMIKSGKLLDAVEKQVGQLN
ncbi:MAG: histidine ammonia-lyase [Cohaesibacter sp.]|nr:histidine ammonia-lyase [Cohaesibacter sp.]